MLIKVNSEEHRFTLPIPNCLLGLGAWGLRVASRYSDDIPVTPEQLRVLIRELKKARRTFGRLTLVDIESADGEKVKIVL